MAFECMTRASRRSTSSLSHMKPIVVKLDCLSLSDPDPTFCTSVGINSGHSFRGNSIAAIEAINWAAEFAACVEESSASRAAALTLVLTAASIPWDHLCCTSRNFVVSRYEKAFFSARPAACLTARSALSFASSRERIER